MTLEDFKSAAYLEGVSAGAQYNADPQQATFKEQAQGASRFMKKPEA